MTKHLWVTPLRPERAVRRPATTRTSTPAAPACRRTSRTTRRSRTPTWWSGTPSARTTFRARGLAGDAGRPRSASCSSRTASSTATRRWTCRRPMAHGQCCHTEGGLRPLEHGFDQVGAGRGEAGCELLVELLRGRWPGLPGTPMPRASATQSRAGRPRSSMSSALWPGCRRRRRSARRAGSGRCGWRRSR